VKYVIIYQTAPSNMGGDWSKPIRTTINAQNDEEARKEMQAINKNWASVLACFPADSEVKLK